LIINVYVPVYRAPLYASGQALSGFDTTPRTVLPVQRN
jgi:hypothetical protein